MPNNSGSDASHSVAVDGSNPGELRHNALGLLTTAAMTAAYMGPALSIYALFGPMTERVGMGVGFVLIVATVLTLLSAISFGMLAKEMPSAGALYAWSTAALGKSPGLFIGLNTLLYYLVSLVFTPIIFGQFFNAALEETGLLERLGYSIPPDSVFWTWSWTVGALIMISIGAYVTYRGIVVAAHLAFTLLIIELAVVAALAFTFLGLSIANGTFTWAPMTLGACKNGWHGVFLALPMGLMCTVCDAAVPASEETHNARRTIPLAVCLTCLLVGIWYVIGFSSFAMAFTPADIPLSSAQNSITPMAARVWGPWKILVSLTAMTASLGAFIPIVTAASRMTFAMAREGKLPGVLAKLNPRYQAPWNAIHLAFGFTFVALIPVYIIGQTEALTWWSSTMAWFIGIVYLSANLVNIVYYWRFMRSQFHWILNLAVPAVALVVHIFVVWQSGYVELKGTGLMGLTAQIFMAVVALSVLAYSVFMRNHSFAHDLSDENLVMQFSLRTLLIVMTVIALLLGAIVYASKMFS